MLPSCCGISFCTSEQVLQPAVPCLPCSKQLRQAQSRASTQIRLNILLRPFLSCNACYEILPAIKIVQVLDARKVLPRSYTVCCLFPTLPAATDPPLSAAVNQLAYKRSLSRFFAASGSCAKNGLPAIWLTSCNGQNVLLKTYIKAIDRSFLNLFYCSRELAMCSRFKVAFATTAAMSAR